MKKPLNEKPFFTSETGKYLETYELGYFLRNGNLNFLLNPEDVKRYETTFGFLRYKRNEYIHRCKMENTYNWHKILDYFCLLEDYFDKVIHPTLEKIYSEMREEETIA